jgi:hypothetical protein
MWKEALRLCHFWFAQKVHVNAPVKNHGSVVLREKHECLHEQRKYNKLVPHICMYFSSFVEEDLFRAYILLKKLAKFEYLEL